MKKPEKKYFLTVIDLDKLLAILSNQGYINKIDFKLLSTANYNNSKEQMVIISGSKFMLSKITSYIRYYIYPFRKE